MMTVGLARCVEGDEGNVRLALFTCNTIKVMCSKIEEAQGDVKKVITGVMGKGWRKETRKKL
jgi:hypothetical protein